MGKLIATDITDRTVNATDYVMYHQPSPRSSPFWADVSGRSRAVGTLPGQRVRGGRQSCSGRQF